MTRLAKGLGALSYQSGCRLGDRGTACGFSDSYPDERLVRTALRGLVTYQMSWFDAQVWAYAETNGIDAIFPRITSTGACTERCKS